MRSVGWKSQYMLTPTNTIFRRVNRDRNWLEFLSVVDATFIDLTSAADAASDDVKAACAERIAETQALFTQVAAEDGRRDRAGCLGLLELEKRARTHGLSKGLYAFIL